MQDRFFCYYFAHPDGTPFYVGSGGWRRVFRSGFTRSNAGVLRVLSELRESGQKPTLHYWDFSAPEEAREKELELIVLWGRTIDGGLLENLRIGDRGGVQGRTVSDEQRQAQREAMTGRRHTEDTRHKMSVSMLGNQNRRGYVYTDEERKLRSEQTRLGIVRKRAEREKIHV